MKRFEEERIVGVVFDKEPTWLGLIAAITVVIAIDAWDRFAARPLAYRMYLLVVAALAAVALYQGLQS